MNKKNIIMSGLYGSKLYGTGTSKSDTDYKGVFKTPMEDLILGRQRDFVQVSSGNLESKNTSQDIDFTLVELRRFIFDAMKGQSYALEILFVPTDNMMSTSEIWQDIINNRDKLISNNLKPTIGYTQSRLKEIHKKGKFDYKSFYHIYRVCFQVIELKQTGQLTFPLMQSDLLTMIKLGRIPSEKLIEDVSLVIDRAKSTSSILPDKPDYEFWERKIVDYYQNWD